MTDVLTKMGNLDKETDTYKGQTMETQAKDGHLQIQEHLKLPGARKKE